MGSAKSLLSEPHRWRTEERWSNRDKPAANDKTVPAEPRRGGIVDREHPRSVAKPPFICGRKPSDPHHLRYLQPRALGRGASDEFAVPLCRVHHRAVHRARDERSLMAGAGIKLRRTEER
jgi:hypothetical protein